MKRGALDYLVKDDSFWTILNKSVNQAFNQINITRKLQDAEQALQFSETRYQNFFSNLPVGVTVSDYSQMAKTLQGMAQVLERAQINTPKQSNTG